MQIRLYWQTALLFTPLVAGYIVLNNSNNIITSGAFDVNNILDEISLLLIISYQAYLLIKFDIAIHKKNTFFMINALIPVVFVLFNLFYDLTEYIIKPAPVNKFPAGPVHASELHGYNLVVLLLMIHAAITFFFINTLYVRWQIKKVAVLEEKDLLKKGYLIPMRVIIKVTIAALATLIIISFVRDILTYNNYR